MKPTRPDWLCTLALILSLSSSVAGQYALQFGGGGVVQITDPHIPDGLDQFGIEFWWKASDSIRQPVQLVSRWTAQSKDVTEGAFFVSFSSSTRASFGIRNEAGQVQSVAGSFRRRDAVWRHLAASWNGDTLSLAIDGRVIAQEEVHDFGKLATTGLPMIIGPVAMKKSRQPAVFPGFLADVSLWSKPRSAEAIEDAGRESPSFEEAELIAHFRLHELSPTESVHCAVGSGGEGRLSESLARSGWCHTRMWTAVDPEAASLDLYCYDFHSSQSRVDLTASWRNTLVSNEKTEQIGVLWQDEGSAAIQITWVEPGLTGHKTMQLEAAGKGILAAGTTDPAGNIYYLVIQEAPRRRGEDVALKATIHKAGPDGKALLSKSLDMSRGAFNVWAFSRRSRGNMRFSKGALGLILPRTMYISRDGLRHQAAIAVTFSAKTLEVKRMLGTTSSHSKGNILTLNSKGEFIGLDLGDNYPRGVHLHKFTTGTKSSAVVFTFKTAHGTRVRNGSPVYEDISGDGQTFYKWSNDNNTYTDLGGVVEDRKGYSVIFSTDQSLEGKVLDNSRAIRNSGDPRNLAMVRVKERFGKGGRGSTVSDGLMVRLPKKNQVETGGFFTFAGKWTTQRVTGVHWLTQYQANEAARSPQVIRTLDGGTLVLWRKTGRRNALGAIKIDDKGRVPAQPMRLGIDLTFNREDRLVRVGDRIWLLASEPGGAARLYFVHDAK